MGNTQSEVTSGAKKQADSDNTTTKIYSLLDLKKGGKLIELMRQAYRERDFTGVDDKIKQMVTPFLYNDGAGKMIAISKIIRMRNLERPMSKRLPSDTHTCNEDEGNNEIIESTWKRLFKSICCLVWCRSHSSTVHSETSRNKNNLTISIDNTTDREEKRLVCWKLEERGAVGESGLHLCFLVATVVHLELARRLIRLFPKLVNDIYISDEYYGESSLHIAVVNEDPSMVKFLLDNGAYVQERAIGNFFCADDQKKNRLDSIEHEYYNLPLQTNYSGHVYWGEYPLAFAACLELEDCYRLLLAKQANPDWQDSNGNTVTHMCIIVNKINMFDFAYENGASINIHNKQGLTPLSLAAKLTRSELFFHILNIQREVYWIFTEIAFAAYNLDEIDSIDTQTGEINETSALTVIVFGEELGHLNLMSGVIMELLREKWNKFARKQFFNQIKQYFVYFIISMVTFILRPAPQGDTDSKSSSSLFTESFFIQCNTSQQNNSKLLIKNITTKSICWGSECINNTKDTLYVKEKLPSLSLTPVTNTEMNHCYLWQNETINDQIIRAFELATFVGALLYVLIFTREIQQLGLKTFIQTWSKVPGRVMFGISCILILLALPLRLICDARNEDRLITIAMFLTPMHFLFFCRGFKAVGPFVIMIYKMIISDLLCFVLIYLIFVAGFAQAFFIIFRSHRSSVGVNIYFSNFIDSFMTMFLMSINDFADVYNEFDNTDHPMLGKFLFLVYMIVVSVLLVNMLIAMMGHTYEDIASRPNEWLRQWARIVLVIERSMSRKERENNQQKYSVIRNGQRVFMTKWQTTVSCVFLFKYLFHLLS